MTNQQVNMRECQIVDESSSQCQCTVSCQRRMLDAPCCPLYFICGNEWNTVPFVCCPLVAFGLFQTHPVGDVGRPSLGLTGAQQGSEKNDRLLLLSGTRHYGRS